MSGKRLLVLASLATSLAATAPRVADAELIVREIIRREIPDPLFEYKFSLFLGPEPGRFITPGDFFTVYDITGLIPGSNSQLGPDGMTNPFWAASFDDLGRTPDVGTFPDLDDDPSILNVTWRYTGADTISVEAGMERFLGSFFVFADQAYSELVPFFQITSQTTVDPNTGEKASSFQQVSIVPEPAAWMLLALGVAVVAGAAGHRRRRRPAPVS